MIPDETIIHNPRYFATNQFKAVGFSAIMSFVIFFLGCASGNEPNVENSTEIILETQTGKASYYGKIFEGKKTASGEMFNSSEMVAAHPTYEMGTIVRVTNIENNDTVTVRITDRGPTYINRKEGVIIDVSKGAAERLNMIKDGRVEVRVDVLKWGTAGR